MKHRIITISREFGSGGRTIGKKVAQALNIPCYDSELIQQVAEESGFDQDYIKGGGGVRPRGLLVLRLLPSEGGTQQRRLPWKIQYQIITDLAEKRPCVIVGRCADYILRDKADCLRVFIHADMDFRAKRIVEVYGEREESPAAPEGQGQAPGGYYRFYTDLKWGSARTTISPSTAPPWASKNAWSSFRGCTERKYAVK